MGVLWEVVVAARVSPARTGAFDCVGLLGEEGGILVAFVTDDDDEEVDDGTLETERT